MKPLLGRTAVVAGASRGIGRAVARTLADLGARVIGVARSDASQEGVEALQADVFDAAWLDELRRVAPQVDIAVHNAMISPPYRRVEVVREDEVRQAMEASTIGLLRLAQAVAPGMARRRWGRLLVIGSSSGVVGGPGQYAYATAKAALVGAVRTLAVEYGPSGVTANLVVPGLITTGRTVDLPEAVKGAIVGETCLRREGLPEEVAWTVATLACPAAGFTTGAVIHVDGGLGLGAGLGKLL